LSWQSKQKPVKGMEREKEYEQICVWINQIRFRRWFESIRRMNSVRLEINFEFEFQCWRIPECMAAIKHRKHWKDVSVFPSSSSSSSWGRRRRRRHRRGFSVWRQKRNDGGDDAGGAWPLAQMNGAAGRPISHFATAICSIENWNVPVPAFSFSATRHFPRKWIKKQESIPKNSRYFLSCIFDRL